jgi:TRAP transporter TAXI family solute receptor
MKRTLEALVVFFSVLLALALFLGGSAVAASPGKEIPMPKMMTWTAYDVGSAGYLQTGYISETIWDKYKIKIRIIPAGSDLPRVFPIRLKDADVAFHGLGSYFMQEGMYDYSTKDWGPQPIRVLWLAQHPGLTMGVRGDSSIRLPADLRGKRVASFPGYTLTLINEVYLVFAGLSWAEVKKVDVPTFTAAMKMVMEGKIDGSHFNPSAAMAYEAEAMPQGLRYVPLPFSDKEGWARVKRHTPFYIPSRLTIGAGLSPAKFVEGPTYPYPVAISYDFLPMEKAYSVTKLLHESFPAYGPKHKSLEAYWPLERFLELYDGYPIPLHEGTLQYLKEIGKWTPERESLNKKRITHQADLQKVWKAAVAEGSEKKMKDEEISKLWLSKKAAAGL